MNADHHTIGGYFSRCRYPIFALTKQRWLGQETSALATAPHSLLIFYLGPNDRGRYVIITLRQSVSQRIQSRHDRSSFRYGPSLHSPRQRQSSNCRPVSLKRHRQERTFVDFSPNGSASWDRWGHVAHREALFYYAARACCCIAQRKSRRWLGTNTQRRRDVISRSTK
jgi:hypothetical protein